MKSSKEKLNQAQPTQPPPSTPPTKDAVANASAAKTGPIAKMKNAKDTLPIAKTPKRQKSSRFHVSEKVELEKLPNLKGICS
jgi:serine/threonine-protein phosphatase 2A regulatory subunit B'